MGFGFDGKVDLSEMHQDDLELGLTRPNSKRISHIFEALRRGMSIERIYELSHIDPWFLHNFMQLVEKGGEIRSRGFAGLDSYNFV